MKKLFTILVLLISVATTAQNKLYYNLAVNNCKEKKSEKMIDNCLKGSYLLNYDFKTIDGDLISTDKVKKPIILIAVSSRVAPFIGLIPSLNKFVENYYEKVEFLMLFWDREKGIERVREKLNAKIKLIPATKNLENKAHMESYGFVHKLDYPTVYLLDKNKKIITVERGAAYPSKTMNWDQVNQKNTKTLEAIIAQLKK